MGKTKTVVNESAYERSLHAAGRLWGSLALLLMLLVFVPGVGIEVNGSRRWVNLYFLDLQSVEVLKFAIIVFLAGSVSLHQDRMNTFKYGMLPGLATNCPWREGGCPALTGNPAAHQAAKPPSSRLTCA